MSASAIMATRRGMKELVDGTIRVSLDIDPQYRADFFRLFPEIDMPVALAPIQPGTAGSSGEPVGDAQQPEQPAKGGSLARSAAMVCQDERFQRFVSQLAPAFAGTEAGAASYVRRRCGVASRAELDASRDAAQAFAELMGEYRAWLAGQEG